jgi:hypothetical protein
MPKFKRKPVVIEAELYDGTATSVERIMDMGGTRGINNSPEGLYIVTFEGIIKADKGDWVIKGVSGERYPCKPDTFEMMYERVDDK